MASACHEAVSQVAVASTCHEAVSQVAVASACHEAVSQVAVASACHEAAVHESVEPDARLENPPTGGGSLASWRALATRLGNPKGIV